MSLLSIATNPAVMEIALYVLNKVVEQIFTQENYEKYGDQIFDILEKIIVNSENTLDDKALLPLIEIARGLMGIHNKP